MKALPRCFIKILIVIVVFFNYIQFANTQTNLQYSISSDYGPREVGGQYDWHNGLDFGTGNVNKIINAIESGKVNLSRGTLNVIAIGGSYFCERPLF